MLNVQYLARVKVIEQFLSFLQVVTMTGEPLYTFLLLGNVSLALRNVPFRLLQMLNLHFAMR
ncbi:hypothetical protein ACVIHI_000314 [Bradyrhizobium sp. USDA 4524]